MSEGHEERLIRLVERIACSVERIEKIFETETQEPATSGTIFQIEGESIMAAITGTKVGGSSVFLVTWNGGMTPGAPVVWTSSDPGITFAPVPTDPTGNSVTATDVVADTLTSYTLTVTGTASDGTKVTATATVPLLTAPATGGTISQLS
jgi:hypothetical protein